MIQIEQKLRRKRQHGASFELFAEEWSESLPAEATFSWRGPPLLGARGASLRILRSALCARELLSRLQSGGIPLETN